MKHRLRFRVCELCSTERVPGRVFLLPGWPNGYGVTLLLLSIFCNSCFQPDNNYFICYISFPINNPSFLFSGAIKTFIRVKTNIIFFLFLDFQQMQILSEEQIFDRSNAKDINAINYTSDGKCQKDGLILDPQEPGTQNPEPSTQNCYSLNPLPSHTIYTQTLEVTSTVGLLQCAPLNTKQQHLKC